MGLFSIVSRAEVKDQLAASYLMSKAPDALLEEGNGIWVFDAEKIKEFSEQEPQIPLGEIGAMLAKMDLVLIPKDTLDALKAKAALAPTGKRKGGMRLTADRKKSLQHLINSNLSDEQLLAKMQVVEPRLDLETLMHWVGICTGQIKPAGAADPLRAARVEMKEKLGLPTRGRLTAQDQARLDKALAEQVAEGREALGLPPKGSK